MAFAAPAFAEHALHLHLSATVLDALHDHRDMRAGLERARGFADLDLARLDRLGVRLGELRERDAALLLVDSLDDDVDVVALGDRLLRMGELFAATELGDVQQALDVLL